MLKYFISLHIIFNIQERETLRSACNYNHSILSFIYLVSFKIYLKTFITSAHLECIFSFSE